MNLTSGEVSGPTLQEGPIICGCAEVPGLPMNPGRGSFLSVELAYRWRSGSYRLSGGDDGAREGPRPADPLRKGRDRGYRGAGVGEGVHRGPQSPARALSRIHHAFGPKRESVSSMVGPGSVGRGAASD